MEEAIQLYNTLYKEEGGMVLLSICDSGSFSLNIGHKRYKISTGDILICPPGLVISKAKANGKDSDIKYLGVKYGAFLESIRTGRNVWSILMYARRNPVFHLEQNDRELTSSYYKVIAGKMHTQRSYYYDEIMRALLQCVLYELCVILNRDLGDEKTAPEEKRKDYLFKRFMEMISEQSGRQRNLKYYADALVITPKYLSSLTKDICGFSAHELILNNSITYIRQQLEFSSKSIKELAGEFGFPNLSSFGKFVKTRLGRSPRAIRLSAKNNYDER